ncbi:MAG: glucosaminidase domain-containing protein [Eggerthellaceae bacterium]|nr:glucosaminidase domain-containing protein [Eggerthellaceae bacterium]
MKHARSEVVIEKPKRGGLRIVVVLLILALIGAGAAAAFWFADQRAQRIAAADAAVQNANGILIQTFCSHAQGKAEELSKELAAQAAEEEKQWLASLDEHKRAKIEEARKAAEEAAYQKQIEDARAAYEAEVEAERARRGADLSDVILIGDSVMEYATGLIYQQLPGASLNALGGRMLEVGPPGNGFDENDGVLDIVRAEAGAYTRYVIGTGNNDGLGFTPEVAEDIIATLGDGAEIYFVTQASMRNVASMDNTNATIELMCEEHDNVHKIDWRGLTSGRESELLMADGIHPTQAGTAEYVSLVYDAITSFDAPPFDPGSVVFDPSLVQFDPKTVDLGPEQTDNIMGKSDISAESMAQLYKEHGVEYPTQVYADAGAPTIEEWCKLCVEEAAEEGVRAEVLFAQAMHETAWLQFGNQVSVEQCNFGGLGAVNSGGAGEVFPDVRTGLRAQVQHLKAYASKDSLKHEVVDTRFDLVERGCAPTVFDLGGRWAWPGDGYGDAIMAIVADLYDIEYGIQDKTVNEEQKSEE